ncbi:MAG: hypothetical protein R3246_11850 [Acidimicrobiia bacterium]|nr:hypothetical protein [Acidimicrobiia bacterium]
MTRRRPVLLAAVTAGLTLGGAVPAAAHGLGGRLDLPVPLTVFVGAAAAVLIFTFAGLAILWPTARLQEPVPERQIRRLPLVWNVLGGIGVFFLALAIVAGTIGVDNSTRNPAAVILFVGFWLIVPFTAALLVDLYQAISPWRRLPVLTHWHAALAEPQKSSRKLRAARRLRSLKVVWMNSTSSSTF